MIGSHTPRLRPASLSRPAYLPASGPSPARWLERAVALLCRTAQETLALADAGTTPQRAFEQLRAAHTALAEARHALLLARVASVIPDDDGA